MSYIYGMEKMFTREGVAHKGATFKDEKGREGFSRLKSCGRCGGVGGWKGWPGYTCYDCGGKGNLGYECIRVYTAAELIKLNATQAKRQAKAEAKRAAKQAEFEAAAAVKRAKFMAANGELVAKAQAVAEKSPLIASLLEGLAKYGDWTEKQMALVAKVEAEVTESAAKAAASGWFGKVGERVDVTATVERVASYVRPSFRGFGTDTVWIVSMRTAEGNAVVVKSPSFSDRIKGEVVKMRATVKEHSEYKGEKQTVMMRAAVLESEIMEKEAA